MSIVQIPDVESFNALVAEVERLKQEHEFLKSLMLGDRWLTRTEAMKALGCKDDKLRQLTVNGTLTHRYDGKAPFYCAFSIRSYLTGKNFDETMVDKRLLAARYGTPMASKKA